jgi:hypothetical protein
MLSKVFEPLLPKRTEKEHAMKRVDFARSITRL